MGGSRCDPLRTHSAPCTTSSSDGEPCAALRPSYSNRWYCELCARVAPPVVGSLGSFMGTGSRHHCRVCGRTVCDSCSVVPPRCTRSCRVCYERNDQSKCEPSPREKYIFLVRHAQSTWNQNVDMVKTFRTLQLEDISLKDVAYRAAHLMAREVWHTDHPISEEGVRQTEELRCKIGEMRQNSPTACLDESSGEVQSSSSSNHCGTSRSLLQSERERRYYDRFLTRRQQIYCSPLLRALQTAHLALPEEDGWGSIKLLKDARERFSLRIERDCLGARVGKHIIDRAMGMGQDLRGLEHRVDPTDCAQKWWSDEPETQAEVEVRLKSLWRRLLEEDGDDSCVLVTHSNLIKALLMHFGEVDVAENNTESPVDLGMLESGFFGDSEPEESEMGAMPWQVVTEGSEVLRRLKVDRLQNCGVLGLRCVLEPPAHKPYPEVDGWIDLHDTNVDIATEPFVSEPCWVARDALLMFDSVLVK